MWGCEGDEALNFILAETQTFLKMSLKKSITLLISLPNTISKEENLLGAWSKHLSNYWSSLQSLSQVNLWITDFILFRYSKYFRYLKPNFHLPLCIVRQPQNKMNLHSNDRKRRAWCKGRAHEPKRTTSSVKSGRGNVMAWPIELGHCCLMLWLLIEAAGWILKCIVHTAWSDLVRCCGADWMALHSTDA